MKTNLFSSFILLITLFLYQGHAVARTARPAGAVYVMSNSTEGNKIVVFNRDKKGSLTPAGSYDTGGLGIGGDKIDPLRSQGSLILSKNRRLLIAVNAGSNDISIFKVGRGELTFINKIDSGGTLPNSLTLHKKILYVLNRTSANISGFTVSGKGQVSSLPDSTLSLSSGLYSQIGFSPKGNFLVLMESTLNQMHVYPVGKERLPSQTPVITDSTGLVPFAFIFNKKNRLIVAEAGSGSVSSYNIQKDGSLETITPPVATGERATCWIEAANKGFIYVTNTNSNTLSLFKIERKDGSLTLLNPIVATGSGPIDLDIAKNRFVYVLNGTNGTVSMFEINKKDGSLTELEGSPISHPELPIPFSQGIVAH